MGIPLAWLVQVNTGAESPPFWEKAGVQRGYNGDIMRGVRDYWVVYYLVYFVSVITLVALNWRSFTVENYVYLLAAIAGASIGIALFVAVVSEGIGYMVLLIPRRIRQLKNQGKRELQEEWMAWYRRQQAALRSGSPFDEPPPDGPDDEKEE